MVSESKRGRRLCCEQMIYRRGFQSLKQVSEECNKRARLLGKNVDFKEFTIQQYVACNTRMRMDRIIVLADVLGTVRYDLMDEIFYPPKVRGDGNYWLGERGSRAKDWCIEK